MRIKFSTWAAVAVLAVNSLACRGQTKPGQPKPTPKPAVESQVFPAAGPEEVARIKNLLFADIPLEEFVGNPKAENPDLVEEPMRIFAQAVEDRRQGKPAEAKRKLRQVLSLPKLETRVLLLTWHTLRELGERPPPDVAGKVQGVVMELHNEAGVGTLAAYADGGVRWIGGQGKVSVVELGDADAEFDSLVRDFRKSAEPVVKLSPAAERRRAGEPPFEHFRVSVLTYGGIHVVELYGPGIEDGHFAGPILMAGGSLAEAVHKLEEKYRAPAASPPPP
jgi:hypothetical protein